MDDFPFGTIRSVLRPMRCEVPPIEVCFDLLDELERSIKKSMLNIKMFVGREFEVAFNRIELGPTYGNVDTAKHSNKNRSKGSSKQNEQAKGSGTEDESKSPVTSKIPIFEAHWSARDLMLQLRVMLVEVPDTRSSVMNWTPRLKMNLPNGMELPKRKLKSELRKIIDVCLTVPFSLYTSELYYTGSFVSQTKHPYARRYDQHSLNQISILESPKRQLASHRYQNHKRPLYRDGLFRFRADASRRTPRKLSSSENLCNPTRM
jgi:hypothetical protein